MNRQVLSAERRDLAMHLMGSARPTGQTEVMTHSLCCCSELCKTVIVSYYFNLLKYKPGRREHSSSITHLRECLTWTRLSAAIMMMPVAD